MTDSTRGSGPDDDAKIIDLNERKAKKESPDGLNTENPPVNSADALSANRADTRGKAIKIIRLKSFRIPRKVRKTGQVLTSLSAAIKKNSKRAKYLTQSKTASIPGLHPDRQKPVPMISGGHVTEEQPQVLEGRDGHIRRRGQTRLYPVFLLHGEELEHPDDLISPDDAAHELFRIAMLVQGDDKAAEDGIGKALFEEVALVLLRCSGRRFHNFLNDERVESVCRMVLSNEPRARVRSYLDFIFRDPVR